MTAVTRPRLIKYAEALRALERLVREKGPDFVYTSPILDGNGEPTATCVYIEPKTHAPSCGLGKVFAEQFNVPVDDLLRADQGGDILAQLIRAGVEFTHKAKTLLFEFQSRQDAGQKYAGALDLAIRHANGLYCNDTEPYDFGGRKHYLNQLLNLSKED